MICGAQGLMIIYQSESSKEGTTYFTETGFDVSKLEHALAIQMLSWEV